MFNTTGFGETFPIDLHKLSECLPSQSKDFFSMTKDFFTLLLEDWDGGRSAAPLSDRKIIPEKVVISAPMDTEKKTGSVTALISDHLADSDYLREQILLINDKMPQLTGGMSLWEAASYLMNPFMQYKASEHLSLEVYCKYLDESKEAYHAIIKGFEDRKEQIIEKIRETEGNIQKADGKNREEMAQFYQTLIDANRELLKQEAEMLSRLQEQLHKDSTEIGCLSLKLEKIILEGENPSDAKFAERIEEVVKEFQAYRERNWNFSAILQEKKGEFDKLLGVRQGILERFQENHTFVNFSNFMKINQLYVSFLINPQEAMRNILESVRKAKDFAVSNPSLQTKELVRDIQIAISYIDGDAGVKGLRKQLQQDLLIDALFKGFSRERLKACPENGIPKEIEEVWSLVKAVPFMFQLKAGIENGSSHPLIKTSTGLASLLASSYLPNFIFIVALSSSLNALVGIREQQNIGECMHLDRIFSTQDEKQLLRFLDLMQSQYSKAEEFRDALNQMRLKRSAIDLGKGKLSAFDSFVESAKDGFRKIHLAKTWQEKALRVFLQIIVPAVIFFGIVAGVVLTLTQAELIPLYIALVATIGLAGVGGEIAGLIFGYMPKMNAYLDDLFPETLNKLQDKKKSVESVEKQKKELEEFRIKREEMIEEFVDAHRLSAAKDRPISDAQLQELREIAEKAFDQVENEESSVAAEENPAPSRASLLPEEKAAMPKGEEVLEKVLNGENLDEGVKKIVNENREVLLTCYKQLIEV